MTSTRGYRFDQFTMIAQRARAAAGSVSPRDVKKPPSVIDSAGLVALAFPMQCAGRSIAARFRQSQVAQIRIVFAEGCEGKPADVLLPVGEVPRSALRYVPLPACIVEPWPAVYLQVIVDSAGEFASPVYIGEPKSLCRPRWTHCVNGDRTRFG